MKLLRYGICLNRLTLEDIELVRQWRNSALVSGNMIYKDYISPESQLAWFHSIDNYANFYYIIVYKGRKIGLINNKNTDWNAGTAESGLFLADEKDYNTVIPVAASLILTETGFFILDGKFSTIHILSSNHKAIRYNLALGYEPVSEKDGVQTYILTRNQFESKAAKIREAISVLHAEPDQYLEIVLEPNDYEIGIAQNVISVLSALPGDKIRKLEKNGDNLTYFVDI